MVLVSGGTALSLNDLAQLADKVMEVAVPSVSAVTAPLLATELGEPQAEITRSWSSRSRHRQPGHKGRLHMALAIHPDHLLC